MELEDQPDSLEAIKVAEGLLKASSPREFDDTPVPRMHHALTG